MANFSTLKKSSNDFDKLLKEVQKLDGGAAERETDNRFWQPAKDKAGNALAVIRFLPPPPADGEDGLPWAKYWDHGFQNEATGKWYIEKSLTTIGQPDPVSEYNSKLWESGDDDSLERKQARDQKRRLHYVSNIYVVSDPKNPENEGKVFLFRYGKKIFDKIKQLMNPDLATETKVNPFDFWKGANFKLKVTRQAARIGNRTVNFPNYDESVFLTPGPLFETDAELESVWKQQYSLKEFVDPKNYKSYEELQKRLNDVLGLNRVAPKKVTRPVEEEIDTTSDEVESAPWVDTEEEDPDLARFRSLADD
jgi:hypothetical protein